MIYCFPEHAKSYYRKGEILAALKVSNTVLKDIFCATHLCVPVVLYDSFFLF
jgi:hypothetical protein